MAKNFICPGITMNIVNSGESIIASGSPVLVSKTMGITMCDIPAYGEGNVAIEGVYGIPKAKNETITQGDNLYWDADGNPQAGVSGTGCLTATAQGNVYAGKAFAPAGATDATVQTKLNV